jgi:hypothetical protein
VPASIGVAAQVAEFVDSVCVSCQLDLVVFLDDCAARRHDRFEIAFNYA